MLYQVGSKMYMAVVVFAGMAAGCGEHCSHAKAERDGHVASGQDMHHDLADGMMDDMKLEDELDQMDEPDMEMPDMQEQQRQERPQPPSDEELSVIKERLSLSEEDMTKIQGYVSQIPPALKDPQFNDEEIAKMFVKHYATMEDKEKYEPQSREDLIEEIRHLVEEELPQAMAAHEQQQMAAQQQAAMGAEEEVVEQTPEELEAELDNMDVDDEEMPKTDL